MKYLIPPTRWLAIFAIPVVLATVTPEAQAQAPLGGSGGGSGVSGAGMGGGLAGGAPPKPRSQPPSALPGTRTEKVVPAPSDRIATDMAPNEALFDGINRGDIASVKDAISRGAELNERNILGLTPIDLSVDLGYNDITFLLLSMRGSDGQRGPPPTTGPKSAKADLRALARSEAKSAKTSSKAAQGIAPPPPAAPKLFANDGGSPVPSAGFLGYGSQR
jgi:hypothetical protein